MNINQWVPFQRTLASLEATMRDDAINRINKQESCAPVMDENEKPAEGLLPETFNQALKKRIDQALQQEHQAKTSRDYLGASRLGVPCDRALQFEYWQRPYDLGKTLKGQLLRVFQAGHVFETLAVNWLTAAGYALNTETETGKQLGFSILNGRIQGHVDGIIVSGPEELGGHYPAIWECKSLNAQTWSAIKKRGVSVTHPVYATQMALYQAYMEFAVPGVLQNPVLFMAINKNTADIYTEWVPFNPILAQKASDRGVNILKACDTNEWLPRIATTPTHLECKRCPWKQQCWSEEVCAS